MRLSRKTRAIITNLLIAVGISLIVNIADILFTLRLSAETTSRLAEIENPAMDTVTVQGRTYIVPANRYQRFRRDTIRVRETESMDSLASLPDSRRDGESGATAVSDSTQRSDSVVRTAFAQWQDRNNRGGPGFGGGKKYSRRPPTHVAIAVMRSGHYQTKQLFYFFALSFILVSIAAYRPKKKRAWGYPLRLGVCVLISVLAYFLAPNVASGGEVVPTMKFPSHEMYDTTILLKCSLAFLVAALYGKIYELIAQRQNMILENEKLKSENLQATYSTLINQMNPHFFFNSLNSLSMLVRGKYNKQALTYIDRLSDTFRYILQNGASGKITLEEELKFIEAYKYLLEIRYEGKLFVNLKVDEDLKQWVLPSLTLQPLLENAVKHNTITKAEPLHVEISTDKDNNICVSNSVNPKMDEGEGTGIGLSNLSERYRLLTGKNITIIHNDKEFTVILPLIPPAD